MQIISGVTSTTTQTAAMRDARIAKQIPGESEDVRSARRFAVSSMGRLGSWTILSYRHSPMIGSSAQVPVVIRTSMICLYMGGYFFPTLSTARKASCGISTWPNCFMRFLPSFCFSSSFFLREMSPP